MPTIRLTRRLWTEISRELRWRAARREIELRQLRRDERRREQLVARHMPAVKTIARQVWRTMTHVDIDDLVGQGYVGLLEAARRYTPAAGEFSHFAYFRIRGAMVDAHKRRAYRDETHESLDGIRERLGYLPKRLDTSRTAQPDQLALRRERAELLARVIDRVLPDDQRRVLLAALAGTPLADTAAECGRSVPWARAKLAMARDAVAQEIQARRAA